MRESTSLKKWVEAGYELFAYEGPNDIRVERLARILDLNKSSFYHYFGNIDYFYEQVVALHAERSTWYIADIQKCSDFDPDFLNVMVQHKMFILAHMQLVLNRHIPLFFETFQELSLKIDQSILPLWSTFIGIPNQPKLALQYFQQVRDMFFSRITVNTLEYPFLHTLAFDAKDIVLKMSNERIA